MTNSKIIRRLGRRLLLPPEPPNLGLIQKNSTISTYLSSSFRPHLTNTSILFTSFLFCTTLIPTNSALPRTRRQAAISTPSSQIFPPPTPYCNFTEYPLAGCSPLFGAHCDTDSNICICGSSSSISIQAALPKSSRHRKRFCLPAVKLASSCTSSGQCRAMDSNSACLARVSSGPSGLSDWRCSCARGFVEQNGKCQADPNFTSDPHCSVASQSYIAILGRCIETGTYYAHRSAGRAGGGRGGGGRGRGGVGGRASGSRAWFSSDRNLMRKSGAARPKAEATLFIITISAALVVFISL